MKSRTEILVPLAAIQAVPIAVIAWYRLHRYAWYRYSAIVTELYYHEADTVGQPARDELLNKAFMLFDYVEAHGDTFSIERRNKMAQIKQKIGDALY